MSQAVTILGALVKQLVDTVDFVNEWLNLVTFTEHFENAILCVERSQEV
jgi:hypothetical protein